MSKKYFAKVKGEYEPGFVLCTREIKIGDTYRVEGEDKQYRSEWMTVEQDGMPHDVESHKVMHLKKTYKVIAEISTQAIWVKGGDEFNESEIKIEKYFFRDNNQDVHWRDNIILKCPTSNVPLTMTKSGSQNTEG